MRLPFAALSVAMAVAFGGCSDDKKAAQPTPPYDSGAGNPLFNNEPDASHSPNGDAGGGCKGFGRTPTCGACLENNCCDVTTQCAWTPGCSDAIVCIRACDGKPDTCTQACADQYFAKAGSQYNTLVSCMNSSCHAECPFPSP